jgi:hypothetical protein
MYRKKGHRTLAEEILFEVLLSSVYIVLTVELYRGMFKGYLPGMFFKAYFSKVITIKSCKTEYRYVTT